MKLEVQKFSLFIVVLVCFVNIVRAQFAKGVVRNNVFIKTSSGSSDQLRLNQNTTNFGYFRNPTMTSTLPYNTIAAIKPTASILKSNYPLKRPDSSPWNQTAKPVIAYTLPPNMKLKLENAVRQGQLGSRTRSTKKMDTATTPEYEPTAVNGIIIQNFINHLSTTKSNIESTIPNPNQFYTTPSPEGANMEPLFISNSNSFFPVNHGNVITYSPNDEIKNAEEDDSVPIIINRPANNNRFPDRHAVVTRYPSPYSTPSPLPVTSTVIPKMSYILPQTPVQPVPSKKEPQPASKPLRTPVRRRPTIRPQNNKQQSFKVSTSTTSQHNLIQSFKVPVTNQSQILQPSINSSNFMNIAHPQITNTMQSQNPVPVILTPTKENSMNIYNALSSQQLPDPLHSTSLNAFNAAVGQYPQNQAINQMYNLMPSLQTLTGQFNQTLLQPLQTPQDMPINRPNNSLKQLQLQFLLDCSLLDPQTKTRIPLGTNPVGDDFFFTPMPYINQNVPLAPANVKQVPPSFNLFNAQAFLPTFPSLFPTTPSPLTSVVLTDQSTQPPLYVSISPTQSSHKRRIKKKVKNVYVDLPIVSEVGNMLDKVYNFVEESLVTKVVKKTEKQPARRVQNTASQTQSPQIIQVVPVSAIDGSSEEDYLQRYTTPYYRTTRSRKQRPKRRRRPIASTFYTNRLPSNNWQPISFHRQKRTTLVPNNGKKGNKNYLTTKIHVTSEYNGPQPTASWEDYPDKKKVVQSSEYDDDDDDGYFYDSFALPQFDFDSGTYEDDDDDDDNDSGQKDYDSTSAQENVSNSKKRIKKKVRKNSKQAIPGTSESDSYEDDSDEVDDYYAPSMGSFGNFFGNMYSSMNKYVPSFSGYIPSIKNYLRGGTGSKEMDYNSINREERSTTPKIETRNPKNPKYIFSDYSDYNGIDNPDVGGSWYNPLGSNDFTTATPDTADATQASSDFWNWFGNSNENAEPATETFETNQNSSGWFFGLFGNEETKPDTTTTTTTKRPFLTVDNPMYKPHNWLGILANHLIANNPSNQLPVVSQKVSYDDYQLWRLMPESEAQVTFLEDYRTTAEGAKLQWWKGPTLRGPTDIAIPPNSITDVKTSLDYEEIPHDVVIWDLEKAINFENPPMSRREKLEMEITQEHPMSWYRYHRYNDIVKFLEYLQRKYPSSVELIHIGRTFEGRPLIVAKVSGPVKDNWKGKITEKKKKKANRRSIFIESGTHAREWITPAVATWILDKLVQGLNNSDALGETIRSVDWYVMPVLNPDGYEYSHQFDRLWRKTRSKHKDEGSIFSNAFNWLRKDKNEKEATCYGTDLNRNWNHDWNEKGSSRSECSEFYAGPKAFSEPESKALSKFLEEQKKNIKIYLSLHSYGQIISYPSRANASYNSIKSDDLLDMAHVALEALRGSGSSTRYIVDNTNEMMYSRSGSSDLYAMHDLGIKYSYAIELRDSGTHGFLLPPSNIDSTAKETFEIIKGMVDYI